MCHPPDQSIAGGQVVVQAVVDVAVLQELQIGKLDGLQRLLAITVQQHGGGPVRNQQVMRAVADVQAQGFAGLVDAERGVFQPQQTGQPTGVF